MKIGDYELSPDTIFYVTGNDDKPVTVNAGTDLPMCAIWIDNEPHPYKMEGAFLLPCSEEAFQDLIISSQAAS